MSIFIVIPIVIAVIAVVVGNSNKKKQHIATSNPPNGNGNKNTTGHQQVFTGNYLPQTINQIGVQVLETMHIIGSSKSIDTIAGRYEFLIQIIGTLQKGQNNPRYISDIQKAIDTYKSTYYDRVPENYELALLVKPNDFDLTDFYCKSLLAAFIRTFEEHSEEIKLLKREDAKTRRKAKIKEILEFTKGELKNKCSTAASFATVTAELKRIESLITDNAASSIPLVIESKSTQPRSDITSIKPKQSASKETEFIINPGSTFELTLLGADNSLGKKIQNILLDEKIYDDKKKIQILALFAEFNLKVKEVEAYKKKYSKNYFDKLDQLKAGSEEWKTAGELDKEDLLHDYREIAIKEIYEQPNCDLTSLFEKEPKNLTVDDDLIKEFGFENIQTYLRFADKLDKIRVISSDNYNRQRLEKMVELGLAIRGSSIPLDEILSTLTLKDLNEIADKPEKQFKRKNQAIEFISAIPNIEEKIASKISLRELFKLQPLPEKYSAINLQEISDAWSYTYEVVRLLVDTHRNASYSTQTLKEKQYVKEYKVENWSVEENMCPCAKDLIKKTFPKSKPPKIPYHIGCDCSLGQEYNFN